MKVKVIPILWPLVLSISPFLLNSSLPPFLDTSLSLSFLPPPLPFFAFFPLFSQLTE